MADQQSDVYIQISGEDIHVGRLYSHRRRGLPALLTAAEHLENDHAVKTTLPHYYEAAVR